MRIGYLLPMGQDTRPGVAASVPEIVTLAREVESVGFDSVWTFDHLLLRESPDAQPTGTWEAWTVLTAIAAQTSRVGLGVLVSCTGFREPIITAKIAHTLHDLSDGRLTLGLGAGWYEPDYRPFGIPFDHKVDRFAEAIEIIAALVRHGRSTFTGRYHHTVDAPLLPAVPGRAAPPILVGGRGPRMLGLIAKHADVWNAAWFGLPDDRFAQGRERMLAACEAAGRDPETLQINVGVDVKAPDAAPDEPGVAGDTGSLADAIEAWRAEGVAEIVLRVDPQTRAGLTTLAKAMRR